METEKDSFLLLRNENQCDHTCRIFFASHKLIPTQMNDEKKKNPDQDLN